MMDEKLLARIREIVGPERVSTDPEDLLCYSRDLASSIPDELLRGYGMLGPDVAVSPQNIEQVSELMSFAHRQNIPVTPRSAGSWALGGVLPMEGGIVIDLCSIRRILEFNPEDEYVRLETGIEWKRLIDYVEKRGYVIGANPSSGLSATIGGYLATGGGAGPGVSQFRSVGNQVISLKVVLADGRIVETDPWSSWIFVGSEGTLGLICEITLKIFKKKQRRFFMYGVDDPEKGVRILREGSRLRPYYLSFLDGGMVGMLNRGADMHFLEKAMTITFMFEGTPEELDLIGQAMGKLAEGCYQYPEAIAHEEYEDRYMTGLAFKRLGPSLFVQEFRIPTRFLGEAMDDMVTLMEGQEWGIESLGSEPGSITICVMILADERDRADYLKKFAFVGDFAKMAFKYGGAPFGLGLHGSVHLKKVHGRGGAKVMEALRQQLDEKYILNLTKTTQARIPGPFVNMSMGMMKYLPEVVLFGLETVNYVPLSLIRLGLNIFNKGRLR
jgi:glycolate oxidase